MSRPDNGVTTWQAQAATAHRRLHQIAQLVGEYGELADRTGNADLIALVFQVHLVLSAAAAAAPDQSADPQRTNHRQARSTSPVPRAVH